MRCVGFLNSTLIGPLEQWRRFELAVGLGIGEALAAETGEPMSLALLDNTSATPIVSCGNYDIFWQGAVGLFTQPTPEPSEVRLMRVLEAYGMHLKGDRPDLLIVDRKDNQAIGVVEVKYLVGETMNARFREAAGQVVRYARGYVPDTGIDRLVRASLVVLSHSAPVLLDETAAAPRTVDFTGIQSGALQCWIRDRLLASAA